MWAKAKTRYEAAAAEVERLKAATGAMEAKLEGRRQQEAEFQGEIDQVIVEIGGAIVDGASSSEPRKRLAVLRQNLEVEQAAIATLTDRLREPAAALADALTRLAGAETVYSRAQGNLREQQLRV